MSPAPKEPMLVEYTRREDFIPTKEALAKAVTHFRKLAQERANEGAGFQLACLVLADYCEHRASGDHGGPTLEMIMLAENTVDAPLDKIVAALMEAA